MVNALVINIYIFLSIGLNVHHYLLDTLLKCIGMV